MLYLPADRPVAAVVTTGPLTSVKEQATGAYARALSARGFAALAFDHRTFGESGGQPRQFEQPEGKAADVTAAVTALAVDERTREPPGSRRRHLRRGRLHGPRGGRRHTAPRLRRRRRLLLRRRGVRRVVTGRVPGGDRPRASGRAALASDGGGRDHPRGRARWRRRGDAAARGVRVLRHAARARWATTPTASPSSRSRTRHRSTPKRRRPAFGCRSCSSTPSTPSPRPSRGSSTPRWRTPKSELWLESQGQIDFYDDPRLIDPAVDAIAGLVHEHTCVNTRRSRHLSRFRPECEDVVGVRGPLRSAWPADERASPALSM